LRSPVRFQFACAREVPPGRSLLEARTCLRFVSSIIGAACALASVTDGEIMAREIRRYVSGEIAIN
jgi:hypothetical protein